MHASHRILSSPNDDFSTQHHRRFNLLDPKHRSQLEAEESGDGEQKQEACDQAFLHCLPSTNCVNCFMSLQTEGIDWASVTPETPCQDVTTFLFDGGHCQSLKGDQDSTKSFCNTFNACIVWDDVNGDDDKADSNDNSTKPLDCSHLTTCDWDGIHSAWVGDGVCHDNIEGCYNT